MPSARVAGAAPLAATVAGAAEALGMVAAPACCASAGMEGKAHPHMTTAKTGTACKLNRRALERVLAV
jgi:hypothetical protein